VSTHIDDALRSAIDGNDVPGVVAMAATRDDVVYQGAFGRRILPDGAAMSTDTVFWIASITKAITPREQRCSLSSRASSRLTSR
jgi:methyl acetate hydrolase